MLILSSLYLIDLYQSFYIPHTMTSHELRSTYYLDHSKDPLFNLSEEKHMDALVKEAITNDILKSLFQEQEVRE